MLYMYPQARLEYSNCVDTVTAEQERLTLSQLPQALGLLRETAEQMVSAIHSAMNTFENHQTSLVGTNKVRQYGTYSY